MSHPNYQKANIPIPRIWAGDAYGLLQSGK
jgi:hypothetical protein